MEVVAVMGRIWKVVSAGALVLSLAGISAVSAQDILLAGGGADPVWTAPTEAFAGFSLDQGDLSGDNRRDLIIGATGSSTVAGRVYVLFGGPVRTGNLSLSSANVIVDGVSTGDRFGFATATGYIVTRESDGGPRSLVVSAPWADSGRGRVYLFNPGMPEGMRTSIGDARAVLIGAPGEQIGMALLTVDLDRDGYREIIVGTLTNRVYVLNGRTTLTGTLSLPDVADAVFTGSGIGEVLEAADVTGDGLPDLIFGAPAQNAIYMVEGRPGGYPGIQSLPAAAQAVYSGVDPGDRAGTSLQTADIDGDGIDDILIGAPNADGPRNDRPDAGEMYLIWGGATTRTHRQLYYSHLTIYGGSSGALAGIYVTTGSINRDTPDDIVMLAPLGAGGAGELSVTYGRSRSRLGTSDAEGRRTIDLANSSVIDRRLIGDTSIGPIRSAIVFEVTGEGARDVIVGIPSADNRAGRVFFALSPRLQPSTRTITLRANEGASPSALVPINNVSVVPLSWSASTNGSATWLAATPAAGTSSRGNAGSVQLTADTNGMSPGSYAGTASVTSTSIHLEMGANLSVSLTIDQTRYAGIDAPANGSSPTQPFVVRGWAIDKGVATGTGVDAVEIWAYPTIGPGFSLGTATYGLARSDVAAAHGARFQNSGFEGTFSGLGTGSYRLVARARSAGGQSWARAEVTVSTTGPMSRDDLSGDGKTDFLWQDSTVGWLAVWRLVNGQVVGGLPISMSPERDLNWKVAGSGDFNRDGRLDLLWRNNADGRLRVWYLNGGTVTGTSFLSASVSDMAWRVVGVGDLNGDGWPDLVWHHTTQGWVAGWRMEGVTLTGPITFSTNQVPDTNWQIAAVRDFDNDGKSDLLWHHRTDGWLACWRLDGGTVLGGLPFSHPRQADVNWRVAGAGDMNDDGKTDIIWRHIDGTLAIWLMNGGQLLGGLPLNPNRVGTEWTLVAPR